MNVTHTSPLVLGIAVHNFTFQYERICARLRIYFQLLHDTTSMDKVIYSLFQFFIMVSLLTLNEFVVPTRIQLQFDNKDADQCQYLPRFPIIICPKSVTQCLKYYQNFNTYWRAGCFDIIDNINFKMKKALGKCMIR